MKKSALMIMVIFSIWMTTPIVSQAQPTKTESTVVGLNSALAACYAWWAKWF